MHTVMLNNLFHDGPGFRTGVRASAGLVACSQLIAIGTIRTKYPIAHNVEQENDENDFMQSMKKFSQDYAYGFFVLW